MVALCDWPGKGAACAVGGVVRIGDVTHPGRNPENPCASDYFILQAFYELMVINGNDSVVLYKGNKANSQMRSRTK